MTTVDFRTFLSAQKGNWYPLAVTLTSLSPPAPGNYGSTLLLYGCACFGRFLQMESYSLGLLGTGFFQLARWFQGSPSYGMR